MKKLLSLSALALALAWTTTAVAADGLYVAGNVGVAMATDSDAKEAEFPEISEEVSFDTGLALSAALGYKLNNFRMEAEFAWQQNDLDSIEANVPFDSEFSVDLKTPASGDVSVASGMLNGYVDFPIGGNWTPFVTAGIGMAKVEVNDYNVPDSGEPDWSDDDTMLAWQVGAGVGYALNEQMTLEVKYRYFATDDAEFEDGTEMEFASHNIYLGLRYTF